MACGWIGKEEKTEQNQGLSGKEGEGVMGEASPSLMFLTILRTKFNDHTIGFTFSLSHFLYQA